MAIKKIIDVDNSLGKRSLYTNKLDIHEKRFNS